VRSYPLLSLSLFFPLSPHNLTLSRSSRDEQNYQWPTSTVDTLYYDNHDTVRFRIEEEHWFDQSPTGPAAGAGNGGDPAGAPRSPYTLLASMEDPGLGPCLWWDGEVEE
jgi:DNA-directed RNA polymerase III subunit RPC8